MQHGCRRFEVAIFSKAWCGEFRLFFSNIFTCCASWDGGTWKKEIKIGKKKKKKRFLWPQMGKQTAKADKESASRSKWRRRRWSQRRNWPQWNQRFACESECFCLKTSQFFVFEFWRARRYPDPKEVDKRWTQSHQQMFPKLQAGLNCKMPLCWVKVLPQLQFAALVANPNQLSNSISEFIRGKDLLNVFFWNAQFVIMRLTWKPARNLEVLVEEHMKSTGGQCWLPRNLARLD